MATDTKTRDNTKQGLIDPQKREKQEQDHEYDHHKIAEAAGSRIRRFSLTLKAGPNIHNEAVKLAKEVEHSVEAFEKIGKSEDAILEEVERIVLRAEQSLQSEAKAEKKAEEKEKEKKEEEEKKHHGEHEEHDTKRHEQEKPASANKSIEEKSQEKVEELKAEIAAGVAGTAVGATVAASLPEFTPERDQTLKTEQDTLLAGAEKARIAALPPEEKAKLRLEEIRNGTYKKPSINSDINFTPDKPVSGKIIDQQTVTNFPQGVHETAVKERLAKLREEARTPQKNVRKMGRAAPAERKKIHIQTPDNVRKNIPPRGIQMRINARTSPPLIRPSGSRRRMMGGMTTTTTSESSFQRGEGTTYEDVTEFRLRRPMPSQVTSETEERGGTYSSGGGSGSGGQSSGGGNSGGGSGGSSGGGHGPQRGGLGNPARNILRGGLGGGKGMGGLAKGGTQAFAKQGAKVAAQALLRNPYVLAAIAVILIVIIIILFIIFLVTGQEATDNACTAPPETMTATINGPATANAGQELTYEVKIADTVAAQDVTIVATIPQGQTFVRSDWAKSVVTGSTVTWKATENLPPNSLSPPNFTFNITLSPGAANTNSVLMVDATPIRTTAVAPGAGGNQQAGRQKSTEELKTIYGADQAAVEANLVTIDFQGKQVQVNKLVQGVFEKVNTEITAANTGYAFRQVGTYSWRTKNIPGQNSSELSTHSFGITIDINPDTNPYTTANTHDIPPEIVTIFKNNGFIWGGDWSPQHDWMHFEYAGAPNAVPGSGGSGGCTPGAGGPISANYVPPSADTCGGKYKLNSSLKMNFGDPQCNFNKDALYSQLKAEDPANADVWFNKIIKCESSYNPNAYAGNAVDAAGAWGLYQMGSATPPGSPPPAEGKNGINDRGDVPWVIQTTNATTYGKRISSLGAYWACAR